MLKRVKNEMVSLQEDIMMREERKKLIVRNQASEYNVINLSKVLFPMRRMRTPPCLRCRALQTTDINDLTWMRRIQDAFPCTAWERDNERAPVKLMTVLRNTVR